MKLKEIKKGEYFTLKNVAYPRDSQVYSRCEYDRAERKYWCQRFDDISEGKYVDGNREVYVDFTF